MKSLTTAVAVLALCATTAAFAQGDPSMGATPPSGPAATMQPVANPPAKARAATRHHVKSHARKHRRSHKPAIKAPSDTFPVPAPPPPPPTGAPPHSN